MNSRRDVPAARRPETLLARGERAGPDHVRRMHNTPINEEVARRAP